MLPMISYAQNGEDVRLARAFPKPYKGFYLEVGAYDPTELSITRHFYDRGWRGVSIEPSPTQHARMVAGRPGDTVLNLAVSDHDGHMTFHESVGAGLSTLQQDEGDRFARDGFERKQYRVQVRTLASICAEHAKGTIDFLTVDVEGHEEAVLRGADFRKYRPKVAVVEATRPRSTESTHEAWEPILLEADYAFVAFDGVSRYYVAREHEAELAAKIVIPPNALDLYVPAAQARAERELSRHRHSPIIAASVAVDRLVRRVARGALRRVGLDDLLPKAD